MLDHLQACGYCPHIIPDFKESVNTACTKYTDLSWVNRRGGCPMFPERELPVGRGRVGQQKQKHQDKSYHSKNDGKRKYFKEVA